MAAHNSTHTGKQILLSQKEFPFWIEERRVILKMAIKCQTWVFYWEVLVLSLSHMQETVSFVPDKFRIFKKKKIILSEPVLLF